MSDKLGMVQLAPHHNAYLGGGAGFVVERPFSEDTARVIDAEVHRIIDECHEQALRLLRLYGAALDALPEALLARETLDEKEILEVTRLPPAPALPGRPLTVATEGEPVVRGRRAACLTLGGGSERGRHPGAPAILQFLRRMFAEAAGRGLS